MQARMLLLPFVPLYWLVVRCRDLFFEMGLLRQSSVPVPVVSVGNISAGGTGKTPFVEFLSGLLGERHRVAVVSRGYGRRTKGTVVVSDGARVLASAAESGDEAQQIAHSVPGTIVIVDERRVRGATTAIAHGADAVILDDGFQHRYLKRDLNIVLMTAREIADGEWMLPAGNRREPVAALQRADHLVVTKCIGVADVERGRALAASVRTDLPVSGVRNVLKGFRRFPSGEPMPAASLAGSCAVAFSGIGEPASFDALLTNARIQVAVHRSFTDHHWYTETDINDLVGLARGMHVSCLMTTAKDAMRLDRELLARIPKELPLYVAALGIEPVEEDASWQGLCARLRTLPLNGPAT